MMNHATGGFLAEAQSPVGRFFWGDLEQVPAEQLPLPVGRFYTDAGARLVELAYILRGVRVDGTETDSLIDRIRYGVEKDGSIQFTLNPMMAPGAWMQCDLDGYNLFDARCEHIPGVRYEDPLSGEGFYCTATIHDARQVEGSLVWRGATPGALVQRAADFYARGLVGTADIQALEEKYGARIIGEAPILSLPIPRETSMSDEVTEPTEDTERAVEAELVAEPVAEPVTEPVAEPDETFDRAALDADVARLEGEVESLTEEASARAAAVAALEVELEAALTRVAELERVATTEGGRANGHRTTLVDLRAALAVPEGEDLVAYARGLAELAALGAEAREDLVAQCVAERRRAYETVNAETYPKRLAKLTLAELREELADNTAAAEAAWQPGRQVGEPAEVPVNRGPRDVRVAETYLG